MLPLAAFRAGRLYAALCWQPPPQSLTSAGGWWPAPASARIPLSHSQSAANSGRQVGGLPRQQAAAPKRACPLSSACCPGAGLPDLPAGRWRCATLPASSAAPPHPPCPPSDPPALQQRTAEAGPTSHTYVPTHAYAPIHPHAMHCAQENKKMCCHIFFIFLSISWQGSRPCASPAPACLPPPPPPLPTRMAFTRDQAFGQRPCGAPVGGLSGVSTWITCSSSRLRSRPMRSRTCKAGRPDGAEALAAA